MENGAAQPETLWVGKDHLTITADHVVIDVASEVPDWQVREFQRMPIFVGDTKFFLCQKSHGTPPFAMRYVLERWPDDAHFDTGPFSFTYDEEFVRQRDAENSAHDRSEKLGRALLCLYPFLGLLWAATKRKLIPLGFIPRSITSASIFATFCLMMLQGALIKMQAGFVTAIFGSLHGLELGLLAADYLLFVFLLADLVLRFDQHLKHVENPWGFGEWIMKPFRKKPADEEA